MSERICNARTVTERKANRTLREKGVRYKTPLTVHQEKHLWNIHRCFFLVAVFELLCNEEAVNYKERVGFYVNKSREEKGVALLSITAKQLTKRKCCAKIKAVKRE
jgi:hypothetical protein